MNSLLKNAMRRPNISAVTLSCAIGLGAIVALTAIRAHGEEPAAAASRPSDDDLRRADWIAQGRTKFVSACAYCHGSKGNAGKVRSFLERESWDPQIIHDTIKNGRTRGANVMPPWGDSIPDPEIWQIVAYIKSLSIDFKGPIDSATGQQ